jgi:hypothetical protein
VEPGEHRYYGEQKFNALFHAVLGFIGWKLFCGAELLGGEI